MTWEGECNQCGRCCTKVVRNGTISVPMRCEHLRILGPELTECAVWADRVAGMPVRLLDVNGQLLELSTCAVPDYPQGLPDNYPLPGPCSYRWKPTIDSR